MFSSSIYFSNTKKIKSFNLISYILHCWPGEICWYIICSQVNWWKYYSVSMGIIVLASSIPIQSIILPFKHPSNFLSLINFNQNLDEISNVYLESGLNFGQVQFFHFFIVFICLVMCVPPEYFLLCSWKKMSYLESTTQNYQVNSMPSHAWKLCSSQVNVVSHLAILLVQQKFSVKLKSHVSNKWPRWN